MSGTEFIVAGTGDETVVRSTEDAWQIQVNGGDWDRVAALADGERDRIVVNMGPQHPSTHGVLRLILELDGETVTDIHVGIGYLHTGIEKTMEFRTWTQGVTLVTRMDYLTPLHNELAYCLAVEKLLGISDQIPDRANVIRVMMMELNRISNHLVALATGGMELGALTAMTNGFRERESVLDLLEAITGLRMNHAYIRPGGVKEDLPAGIEGTIAETVKLLRKRLKDNANLLIGNSIWVARTEGIGYLNLAGCMALGVTGPVLRSTGLPADLRKDSPYCGYENYEFEVVTQTTCDAYGRFLIRMDEMQQSLNIIEQCLDKLRPGPVMVADKRIGWPSRLTVGSDGQGNSPAHVRQIMDTSMEALIHHFKLVTEGFSVPPGQVYAQVESPKGVLGCHVVSDGGTRPYRAHMRDPSFVNLQSTAAMCVGGM
ncbi:MAG: NADH-quinone oxidoreductase subunit D, partial [Candidatus Nanopelagicales bacterium]|nr:NADH-quinone oxidoreductase subunit D [Candidatus Nanopelagicales bacterium]